MKKIIFVLLLASCSTLQSSVALENRTYYICKELDGFCWSYYRCAKKFIGICLKQEAKVDKIEADFKDKIQAKQLLDMGFTLKVTEKSL